MERQNDEVNVFEYFILYCFYVSLFLEIIYSQLDGFGCSAGDCLNLRCFCPLLINSMMQLDLIYFGVMHVFTFWQIYMLIKEKYFIVYLSRINISYFLRIWTYGGNKYSFMIPKKKYSFVRANESFKKKKKTTKILNFCLSTKTIIFH